MTFKMWNLQIASKFVIDTYLKVFELLNKIHRIYIFRWYYNYNNIIIFQGIKKIATI